MGFCGWIYAVSSGAGPSQFSGKLLQQSDPRQIAERPSASCREFGSKVRMWCTFNEPEVMGFCGWIYGAFPPMKMASFTAAGHHLWNLFQAHKAAYHAIKAMPGTHC